MNLCDDNRIITIEKAKQALIKGTNIEDSPEEMEVLDNILFRCWQMGWLDKYAPPRHFNAMPKVISERLAAGHGSNVPIQPSVPPMPSNTSNALKALDSVNATQSNALDSISRAKAIDALNRECRCGAVIDHCGLETAMDIISELPPAQPEHIIHCKDCAKHNKRIGDYEELPVGGKWIWKEDACPLIEFRGKAQGHEFDYQFCAYGERKTE